MTYATDVLLQHFCVLCIIDIVLIKSRISKLLRIQWFGDLLFLGKSQFPFVFLLPPRLLGRKRLEPAGNTKSNWDLGNTIFCRLLDIWVSNSWNSIFNYNCTISWFSEINREIVLFHSPC